MNCETLGSLYSPVFFVERQAAVLKLGTSSSCLANEWHISGTLAKLALS